MKATVQKTTATSDRYHRNGTPSGARQKLDPAGETIVLQGEQHAYVRDAYGWIVKALAGTVWITQDGDIRDIVLRAGETFKLDRRGPALLSPLHDARISVTLDAGCTAARPRAVATAQPAFA